MSIFVIVLLSSNSIGFIESWINKQKMTLIPSSISYSVTEFLSNNKNFEFEFNYQNYYIYWFISATLPDGTYLTTQELQKYFSYNVTYWTENYLQQEMLTEQCKTDHVDIFLGLDEQTIKNDIGKTSKNRICIKDSFKMGLIPDVNTSTIKTPAFVFSLYQCANSSQNNN